MDLLLELVNEYQIQWISKKCEAILLSKQPSVLSYVKARQYNMETLKGVSFNYLKDTPLTQLKQEPGFDKLGPELLNGLFMQKIEHFEKNCETMVDILDRRFVGNAPACQKNQCKHMRHQLADIRKDMQHWKGCKKRPQPNYHY